MAGESDSIPGWASCMKSGAPPLEIPVVPMPVLRSKLNPLSRRDRNIYPCLDEFMQLAATPDPFISDTDRGHLHEMNVALRNPQAQVMSGRSIGWLESAVRWWLEQLLQRRKDLVASDRLARLSVNSGWSRCGFVLVIRNFSLDVSVETIGEHEAEPGLKALFPAAQLRGPGDRVYQVRAMQESAFVDEGLVAEIVQYLNSRFDVVRTANLLDQNDAPGRLLLPLSCWRTVYREIAKAAVCVVAVVGDRDVGPGLGYEMEFLLGSGMARKCVIVQSARKGAGTASVLGRDFGQNPAIVRYEGLQSLERVWAEVRSIVSSANR